jgi:hypothetical protein
MVSRCLRHALLQLLRITATVVAAASLTTSAFADGVSSEAEFFLKRIEPILRAECYSCHSGTAAAIQGGLRLDSAPGILRGGDSGPAISPGQSDQSLLLQAIRHENGMKMPPETPRLEADVIADFSRWIELGAPDPRTEEPPVTGQADPRQHWAFQPIQITEPPAVSDPRWVQNPVDAFILSELQQKGWAPASPLGREAWIRRVALDLTGLPPEEEKVQRFLHDESSSAWETAVDELLDSPHYGEQQAQHWLDVIRYAETEGYEYDTHLAGAWRFRDYVIDSLNQDKPWNQFIREQIAGDELNPESTEYQTAAVFHRLGPVRRNAGNPELALSRNEVLTERTDIIGSAVLGLSLGCARCHNHKLEPISQKDYYRLQAYFAATDEHNLVIASDHQKEVWKSETDAIQRKQEELRAQAGTATIAEKVRLEKAAEELSARLPPPLPVVPGTRNNFDSRTEIHVLRRGVWEQKGERVGPRPLSILVPDELPELPPDVRNPRTQLADWLTSDDNPLTARVITNRIWQQHFGTGLVSTPNDFGTHGERPSHPQLLDWLAGYLVQNNWKLRPLHRLLVLSSTYRQGNDSPIRHAAMTLDPGNRLLWHMPRRRLSAEQLRDSMLLVSGRLNRTPGGPGIMTTVTPELVQLLYKPDQWQVPAQTTDEDRRSVYLIAKRNLRLPFMEVFDAPALLTSCARRESSTHAPQALELLNGSLSNDLAHSLAQRLREISGSEPAQLVEDGYRMVVGRSPTAGELSLSLQFLSEQPLEEFALALFNLNDFLYAP